MTPRDSGATAHDRMHSAPCGRRLRAWFRDNAPLLLMLGLLLAARSSFAHHYGVPSGSMEPALVPGDHVVVDMSAYGVRVPFTAIELLHRGVPRRGDIAVFKSPADGTRLIKRVAAVGGDRVTLVDGHLSIDGTPLAVADAAEIERFGARMVRLNLDAGGGPDIRGLIIPAGQVLMLGDHRGDSADGRYFGLVAASTLYGRATGVFYRRDEGLVWKSL